MIGDIDSTVPVSITHFVAQDGKIFHAHGGVVTRVEFESLEEMPIDEFYEKVAPTLKGKRDIAVFGRDSVHENMYRLLGDTAVIYHGVKMSDVFLDHFYKQLQEDKPFTLDLNLPYPLVRYQQLKRGYRKICVYIPEREFLFQSQEPTAYCFSIWHPPIWLSIQLTETNIPNAHRICAVPERAKTIEETRLCTLPFPNVHENGEICFGSTNFNRGEESDSNPTVAEAVQLTYNRFFTSAFNHDLCYQDKREPMRYQYEHLEKDPDIDAQIREIEANSTNCNDRDDRLYFLRLSRCFKTRGDMFRFPYSSLSKATTEDF